MKQHRSDLKARRIYGQGAPAALGAPGSVPAGGIIFHRNRLYRVGKAFKGEYVALRPTRRHGLGEVLYGKQKIAQIDLQNQ
jgi:hypothetical protein